MIQGQSYGWNDLLKVADEAGFTPLPIGDYDVIVAEATVKGTNGGKDSIVVQFQVTTGPQQGRKIRNQFTISPENPNAVGFFFRHMAALGLPREYFAQSPTLPQVAQALLNRPCRIKVSHREWSGQVRDNVDAINPAQPTGFVVPGMTPGVAAPAVPAIPNAPVVPPNPQPAYVPTPAAPPAPPAPSTPALTSSPNGSDPEPIPGQHPGGLDVFTPEQPPTAPAPAYPTDSAPPKLPF